MIRRYFIILTCLVLLFTYGCSNKEQSSAAVTNEEQNTTEENISHETNKTLVVFFSATGTTKGVAEKIAELTEADIYEIKAAAPYTDEDLNYHDPDSRTSIEQNDQTARPEIGSEDIEISDYETIFIAYPIWCGQAPRIMDTFVEKYDFGKITIIPLCTSGSSDIGQSDDALEALTQSGNWQEGRRFAGDVSEEELQKWINEIMKTEREDTEKEMRLFIDDQEISVDWEDNPSVVELAQFVSQGPLQIQMSRYGGFEQVGSLGHNIVSDDKQITTKTGDIVLYSSDSIVIFCGSNSWSYTRLGRISDLSEAEIKGLLEDHDVTVTIRKD